jgi:hypothetical protein
VHAYLSHEGLDASQLHPGGDQLEGGGLPKALAQLARKLGPEVIVLTVLFAAAPASGTAEPVPTPRLASYCVKQP